MYENDQTLRNKKASRIAGSSLAGQVPGNILPILNARDVNGFRGFSVVPVDVPREMDVRYISSRERFIDAIGDDCFAILFLQDWVFLEDMLQILKGRL